jgi:hypothetical protein
VSRTERTSAAHNDDASSDGGQTVDTSSDSGSGSGSGVNAAAATAMKQQTQGYVHLRLGTNVVDFVSVLTCPRPGPTPLDVLRALPTPTPLPNLFSTLPHGHGGANMDTLRSRSSSAYDGMASVVSSDGGGASSVAAAAAAAVAAASVPVGAQGSMMAGGGWASIAGVHVQAARTLLQHPQDTISGATNLDINGVRDAT